jgi:two-component system response regulator
MSSAQTILLIEDNPSDIDLTKRAFEKTRIANELVVAEDGAEAIDYPFGLGDYAGRDAAETPLLTLLDLKLPKLSGLDVLRRVRADVRTKRMPVVVLTTSNEDADVAGAYDLGVNSYIRKPVDSEQFAQAIRQLGLYWLVWNEPPPKVKVAGC